MSATLRRLIKKETENFVQYMMDFYGPNGVHKIDGFNEREAFHCMIYRLMNRADIPFEGDSSDREEAIKFYDMGNNQYYIP